MSKYRCPVCGAPHKDPVPKCRLCGQDMSSPQAVPVNTSGARQVAAPKKGIGVFMLIGLGIVVLILVGALVMGLTRDSETVTEATRSIPGVVDTPDGWVTIEDLEGGFTAALPPGNTADTSVPATGDESGSSWTGEIGDETTITVGFTTIPPPAEGVINQEALLAFAETLVAGRPEAKLVKVTETTAKGYPAAVVDVRYTGSDETSKILLIKKGNNVYSLDSTSVYTDHPSYDRMVDGFAFTQPSA